MKIPLANRLKKRLHVETALLQDEVMDIVYILEENAVLHGGTAIWRCYEGNRFSEDLDFYFPTVESFENRLSIKLKERNLQLLKYKKTHDIVFSKITDGNIEVRLEINTRPKKMENIVRSYEKTDGSFMDVFTLSPEQLLLEKINAYKSRKLIRDIYDVYHLSKYVKDSEVKDAIVVFISKIEKPADEETLKTIVYTGAVPSFKKMIETLKSGFSL